MTETFRSWEACLVCRGDRKEGSGQARSHIEVTEPFQKSLIENFCQKREIKLENLLQIAWAIVIGAFAGTENPCAAFVSKESPRGIFRCHLNANYLLKDLINSIELQEVSTTDPKDQNCSSVDVVTEPAKFDTILILQDTITNTKIHAPLEIQATFSQNLLKVNYEPRLISEQTLSSITESFLATIHGLVQNDGQALCDLDIIGSKDRKTVQIWNGSGGDLIHDKRCIHEVVRQIARAAPESPAICSWNGENFTYRQLDELSDRLAQYLTTLEGVGPDEIVPFHFHKSPWAVIAILSILKAGGAPLGLSPEFPRKRLIHLIDFTSASVLLCGKDLEDTILHPSAKSIVIDEAFVSSLPWNFALSIPLLDPTRIGFVVFTSGSTGVPKGTVLEHAAYSAGALAHQKSLNITPQSRVLHFAAYSFDVSVLEILSTLMAGACICIPSEEQRWNDLTGAINDLRVNWIGITPTLAKLLVPSDVPGLKTMVLWGEASTKTLVDTWVERLQLLNAWGPSECSVISSAKQFSESSRNPSNLGFRTQANYLWVVRPDNYKLLAPIGSVGEVVVQGPIVGKEYLNDKEKTAAVFIQDHSWHGDAVDIKSPYRAYRSGDMVRLAEDGSIEFVGRRDFQIKLRGQRVELGEVEHNVNTYGPPEFASVAEVFSPSHRSSQQILAAFFWPREDNALCPSNNLAMLLPMDDARRREFFVLKNVLSALVPVYMVPEVFIPLASTPSNASGKIDRKMLRKLASELSLDEVAAYSLLNDTGPHETIGSGLLMDIICDVLSIEQGQISNSSTLFSLGADSISAMRIASASRKAGLSISPADILRQPKISSLLALATPALVLESAKYMRFASLDILESDYKLDVVAIRQLGTTMEQIEDIAPATSYQEAAITTGLMQTRGGTNFVSLTFSNPILTDNIREPCRKLVLHHSILRTVFVPQNRELLQVAVKNPSIMYTSHCYQEDISSATQEIIRKDLQQPRKLSDPILAFFFLHHKGKNTGKNTTKRLLIRISHGQYDGISLFRLVKDLRLALTGHNLAKIPSFMEYKFLANSNRAMAENYWRELLADSAVTHILRHTTPPYKNVLDGEVTRFVKTTSVSSRLATIATVFKTAWGLVLAKLSGSQDVVFGATSWGRNAPYAAASEVVGPCMDHIPVRVRIQPNQVNAELLELVQNQHANSLPFENIGFRQIVEKATTWPAWERLSSVILYQNLDSDLEHFEIEEGNPTTVDEIRPPNDRADIAIFIRPHGKQTSIHLNFCEDIIDSSFAMEILDMLCEYSETLAQKPDDLIFSTRLEPGHTAKIPLVLEKTVSNIPSNQQSVGTSSKRKREYNDLSQEWRVQKKFKSGDDDVLWKSHKLNMVDVDLEQQLSKATEHSALATVSSAWQTVLSVSEAEFIKQWGSRTPYFDIWGSHIAAYGIAEYIQNVGWKDMSMEDIMDNPTVPELVKVLEMRE